MTARRVEFEGVPSSGAALRRLVFSRTKGLKKGGTIPRIEAGIRRVDPQPERVAAYRTVCGFPDTGMLPLTYPHILGAPLHLELAGHKDFPLPGMGVVHVRNTITQERPIGDEEVLSVECWVEGHDDARLGWEFGLVTEVSAADEVVWRSVSTALSRRKGKPRGPRPERQDETDVGQVQRSAVWSLSEDLGRRYGRVSGDYNPIHMYAWTAKAFGFKRAIIHGMWSLARCVSELDDDLPDSPVTVDVSFRKPLLLPSRVSFSSRRTEGGTVEYEGRDARDGRVRLQGRCSATQANAVG